MESETCRVCGGDGRITNSFGGSSTACPSCRGTGRRSNEPLFRDVTRTKPAPQVTNRIVRDARPAWPISSTGIQLATLVKNSAHSEETKARHIREIIEHEETHGTVTKTFMRKLQKQL